MAKTPVPAGDAPILPPGSSLVTVEPEGVLLTALKPAEDGDGLVVRVLNPGNTALDASVTFGVPVADATSVDGTRKLALALADGRIDPATAFDAAELDTTWQIEKWGEDKEASDRRAVVRADLELAKQFLDLLAD